MTLEVTFQLPMDEKLHKWHSACCKSQISYFIKFSLLWKDITQ